MPPRGRSRRRTDGPGRPATTEAAAAPGGFGAALETAIRDLPVGLRTRFAPAPTGYLHLGHVANALAVWGVARATGGRVILRIEDHDRQRCRPEYEAALLDDLVALGFEPDEPSIASLRTGASSYRQGDNEPAYAAALTDLARQGLAYPCDCSRTTFARWATQQGHPWSEPGCPGRCAGRGLAQDSGDLAWRVALGEGADAWQDLVLGPQSGEPSGNGDIPVRDRHGNWTYVFCVVVDDIRHRIDLVIRGEDVLGSTAAQIRLGRLLGRQAPPAFLHHPLIRRPDGRKLSKADGSTSVRELLATGARPSELRARAAAAIGLAATQLPA